MEKRRLQWSAFLAVFWMVVLAVTLTTATYAWFTISAVTNVEPMSGGVGEGDGNLLISASADGPFDKECTLPVERKPDALTPLSTSDLKSFYEASAQNRNGISVRYRDATDSMETKALHGKVYLKSEKRDCEVYLRRSGLDFGTNEQILAALRLGLLFTTESGSKTYVFRLDDLGNTGQAASTVTVPSGGSVVSAVDSSGKASFVTDPSSGLADYLAEEANEDDEKPKAGKTSLCTLKAGEVGTVEFWLYMEGCDENCINDVQQKDTGIKLSFAGVTSQKEEQA